MRKIILTLAVVLLAAPVWADVEIKLADLGGGVIEISYDATGETELVRAFALNIVATDGNIIDINDFAVGDENGGFGIMPGAFRDNISVNPTTGQVDSWAGNPSPYTPVAPGGDPDALGDIPGPGITIEMGSLYEDPLNAPGEEGVLCTVTVDENVTLLCVTGNAIRGNVVLEDASEAALNPPEVCIVPESGDCIPNTAEYATQYANWVLLGKPDCWCNDYGDQSSIDAGATGNQCYGDVAGDVYRKGQIVFTTDLGDLADSWEAKLGEAHLNPCADIAHDTYRKGQVVFVNDLNILAANWEAKVLPGDCPLTDAANEARF